MAKIIIGIHGLNNKPSGEILKTWWERSLKDGFNLQGRSVKRFNFDLVYWADLIYSLPLNSEEKDSASPLFIEHPYVPLTVVSRKELSLRRKRLLDRLEKTMDKVFFNTPENGIYSWIENKYIKMRFHDLDAYYNKTCFDEKKMERPVREIICEELVKYLTKYKRRDILLIGHSMGSIIAHDVLYWLKRKNSELKVHTLVTTGSPLGLPVIMKHFLNDHDIEIKAGGNLPTPENITHKWLNFADIEDTVAMNYNLKDDYRENSRGVNPLDYIVYNDCMYGDKRYPHSVFGYLRTPELADAVYNFLTTRKRFFRFFKAGL